MRRPILSILTAFALPVSAASATDVDMELVLAMDISRSMSHVDLATQRRGYAEALTSQDVLAAIERGFLGRIGLTFVEWSGSAHQRVVVDWTVIDTPADARDVADAILGRTGGSTRMTSISAGLLFSAHRFGASPFTTGRRVIDISGDGPNNDGPPVTHARDRIVAKGITINGLPVMAGTPDPVWHLSDLDRYYRDCVSGGPGAFVLPVSGWENFGDAIRRKLILEIAGRNRTGAEPERLIQASGYDCLKGEKTRDRRRNRAD